MYQHLVANLFSDLAFCDNMKINNSKLCTDYIERSLLLNFLLGY